MINVFDILFKKEKEVTINDIIVKKEKTKDYIVSVPHSGTLVFSKYKKNLAINIGREFLLDTDLYTDKVFDPDKGMIIVSKLNPAQLNMNRFKDGSNDELISKHLRKDPLHHVLLRGEHAVKKEYEEQEKQELLTYYDDYHDFLQTCIEKMKKEKGYALMFDLHSFNSIGLSETVDAGQKRSDFNILSLDDTSAHPKIIEAFEKTLTEEASKHGLTVKSNFPYKGGAIMMKYADPENNIHTLGVEIKRALLHIEGVEESSDEFKPKPEGIKLVNSILVKAMSAANETVEKL